MERGNIHGIKVAPSAPMITHFFFADDSKISRKQVKEFNMIKEVLGLYERASSQMVCFDETAISISKGVSKARREELAGATMVVMMVDIHANTLASLR